MKKSLLFISASLLSVNLFSQDVIHAVDGSSVTAKVLEVNTSDIKYKKNSDPDGQTYVMSKSDILSIHYQNGTNDFFTSKTISEANIGEENTQVAVDQTKVENGYNTAAGTVTSADPSFDPNSNTVKIDPNAEANARKQQRKEARNDFLLNLALVSASILINTNCGGMHSYGHVHASGHRITGNRCR